uniref:Sperm-associated antigen 6-like isoform X2 n=1 Tax=Crassostrea virginica TaxID=6565 RepID=A0A8B8BP99_CRAVI|nr:sperm-associated antigen 6-like isoform X2 [Crassostrea virginica]
MPWSFVWRSLKESAAWALGYIARYNAELAQAVVDARTVPLLVLCIQEPELSLKRIAASALSEHSPELAQTVVNAGAIAHLAQMILNPAKLKGVVQLAIALSEEPEDHIQAAAAPSTTQKKSSSTTPLVIPTLFWRE